MTAPSSTERLAVRDYLKRQAKIETGRGTGCLDIVAARAKVAEGELHDIVFNEVSPSDEVVRAVLPLVD